MKLFTFATAFLGVLVTASSALPAVSNESPLKTPFYITAPLQNSVYTANTIGKTTWRNGIPGKFKLTVLEGTDPILMYPTEFVYDVEGSTGSFDWKVPEELVGGIYSFHYAFAGGESYSGQFKVVGGKDKEATGSTPTVTIPSASKGGSGQADATPVQVGASKTGENPAKTSPANNAAHITANMAALSPYPSTTVA